MNVNNKYNIGDTVYVITDVKTKNTYYSDISAKKIDYQYTLILLNPEKKIKLRKRYMFEDNLYKALNNSNPQWQHFPVRN